MKRYFLFVFASYYPAGGWDDFVESFDSIDEAKTHPDARPSEGQAHIVDSLNGEKVWELWNNGVQSP
jgi:hypothetical protein